LVLEYPIDPHRAQSGATEDARNVPMIEASARQLFERCERLFNQALGGEGSTASSETMLGTNTTESH
jgi:hypothetical protein